jgi:hypothetical protein
MMLAVSLIPKIPEKGVLLMATATRAMTLRLEASEHEALLLRSQAEHTSIQGIVHKAIHEYLTANPLDESALLAHGRAIMERYGAVMARLADA